MSKNVLDEMKEKIAEADLVLVGIGEQLAVPTRMMEQDEKYKKFMEDEFKAEYFPYLQQIFINESGKPYLDFYNRLFQLLEGKNYYVLTTNVDDVIYKSDIDKERIVAPCGSITQFVCENCNGEIEKFDIENIVQNQKKISGWKCGRISGEGMSEL